MAPTKEPKRIKLGRIEAAIWENQTKDGKVWFNITVSRRYKDGEEWKNTSSFNREDLLLVAKVVDKAHDWIWEQQATTTPDEPAE